MRITPLTMNIETTTPSHSSIICHVYEGAPLKNPKNWMIFLTAINTNDNDKSIHESLLVIFINLNATTPAITCRIIEITKATSLTIGYSMNFL